MEGNSRSKMVFHNVPFVVIWSIWKRNRNVLYGGQYHVGKIFWEIDTILGRFRKVRWKMETLGKEWSELVDLLQGYKVEYFSKGVRIQDVPRLKVEALVIKECLEYCHKINYQQIILETDSWSLVQILQGTWESPWNVILEIKLIKSLFRGEINFNNADELPAKGIYYIF
ncbi:hypothetical protein H5410_026920 [Solanum commersonii]|uniref:RNase H type-1 domain-containing protein n=1 Tax=Solanum commersonii TaxID=4109 RepID=A0A9J5Z208_SOLCO|nr:hypothetical protein H5410_026920 [Solanum commersonii]